MLDVRVAEIPDIISLARNGERAVASYVGFTPKSRQSLLGVMCQKRP